MIVSAMRAAVGLPDVRKRQVETRDPCFCHRDDQPGLPARGSQSLAEINDAFGFGESDGAVESVTSAVLEKGVGCEFRATLCPAPCFDSGAERAADIAAAMLWLHVDSFQESHGRGLTAIDMIMPERRLCEAENVAPVAHRDEGHETAACGGEHGGDRLPVLVCILVRPKGRAQLRPAIHIRLTSKANPHERIDDLWNVPGQYIVSLCTNEVPGDAMSLDIPAKGNQKHGEALRVIPCIARASMAF